MAFLLIPVILLAVVWLSYICRRLSELNENVNTAMNQIGLQLSSRFRALEALLELARTHGLSAQLVLLPPVHTGAGAGTGAASCTGHVLHHHCGREPPFPESRPRLPALHGSGQLLQSDGLYQQPDLQRFRHPAQLCTGAKAPWPAGRSAGHCPAGIPAVCTGCTGGLSCPALAAFSAGTRIKLLHRKSPAPWSA